MKYLVEHLVGFVLDINVLLLLKKIEEVFRILNFSKYSHFQHWAVYQPNKKAQVSKYPCTNL